MGKKVSGGTVKGSCRKLETKDWLQFAFDVSNQRILSQMPNRTVIKSFLMASVM